MANTATLAIQIISDATKAAKGFQQAGNETSKFEQRLKTANRVAIATSGTLIALGAASLKQASALQQSSGSVKATFGTQAKAINDLAKKADQAVGLSRSSYQQTAAVFGAQLKNMGVAASQLVPKTDQLIGLGADLAATFGGTTSDAVEAISALLRGERDPIEKYGVSIKQADINARLAAQGQDKLTGSAKAAATTQATLALLTEQTAGAHGQFAKEANTAEGAAQRMQAKLDNMSASLGTILLPAAAAASTALGGLANVVEQHTTAAQIAAGVIAALAAVVIATNVAMKVYAATQALAKLATLGNVLATVAWYVALGVMLTIMAAVRVAAIAWTAAQWALNVALDANPIGLVVIAVAALIAGLILAYKKSATFRAIVQAAGRAGQVALGWVVDKATELWQWLSSKLGPALGVLKDAAVDTFDAIVDPIKTVIEWVGNLIHKLGSIHWPSMPSWLKDFLGAGGKISDLFGSYTDYAAPAAAGGARYGFAPAVFTAPGELKAGGPDFLLSRVGGAGGAAVVQINVTGALDPNAVAKQIEQILTGRGRRLGRIT